MELLLETASPEQTIAVGEALGQILQQGDLLCLDGELGSGKTTLCSGIGRGLGSPTPFSSPSYLLCKEYQTDQGVVLHLDAYFQHRLDSLLGEGLIERFDGEHLVMIEWASRIADWLPEGGIWLQLEALEDQRKLRFSAVGERARARLSEFCQVLQKQGISAEPSSPETR
jgi:tRNA threonylcarbamoyladenosine biosynthesis protein TsaE